MPIVSPLKARGTRWAALVALALAIGGPIAGRAQDMPEVDTALVVSIDVSNSVDATRYRLQLEGIAKALEDDSVIEAILSGGRGGILISLVMWADKPKISVPWSRISSKEEALAVAQQVRRLPREGGEFTCMSGMMRMIADKVVTQIPAIANRCPTRFAWRSSAEYVTSSRSVRRAITSG